MKRKPTTKQTVRAELLVLLRDLLKTARETGHQVILEMECDEARGAIRLATRAEVINWDEGSRLQDLVNNARHQRFIELTFEAPPYTGADRAQLRQEAGKAAA